MAGFDNGVVYGSNVDFTGTTPVSGQINLDGELLVGASVAPFIRSHVPTGSGNLTVTTGPGTIDFGLSGPITPTSYNANGVLLGQGTNPIVSIPPSTLGTLFQSLGPGVNPGWTTATYPSTTTINQILYSSAANTITGLATANNGTLVTSSAGVPSILAGPGVTGKILQSNAAAAPSFSTATYPSTAGTAGKVLISDGTNIVSSTPTYPNTSGTAGKVVVSDGTNNVYSTPTFPNASATSGKIIKSDGTNWLASTETYAAPGTSGNVMTSDGTNWISTPASASVVYCISTYSSVATPGDGSTYFLSLGGGVAASTQNAQTRIYFSRSWTIVKAYGASVVLGTLASNENSTLSIRLNNTTDTAITSTLKFNAAATTFNNTGLSVAVVAGDYIEVKLVNPTWVTNPTTIGVSLTLELN